MTRDEPEPPTTRRPCPQIVSRLRGTRRNAAEIVWVLRVAYKFDRATAAASLRRIIDTDGLQVEDGPTTRLALAAFEAGAADFADYLILESAPARRSATSSHVR
jgi:predicted nucleic-acid-binding protein